MTKIYGEKIPEDWKSSTTKPIYKGKGDAMECGKYRWVRLLEHGKKVYEYVLEKRMRDMVSNPVLVFSILIMFLRQCLYFDVC